MQPTLSLDVDTRTLRRELSVSRRRTEHFQSAQSGCAPSFDPELIENFEDVLFYRGFAIAQDSCDLAVGFALGKP